MATKEQLRKLYDNICAGRELRPSLIELKMQLKAEDNRRQFGAVCGGNYDPVMKCLADEDPKVRKNAAAVLGLLKLQESVDVLMDAYLAEDQLFVRPEYVKAMAGMDCGEYLDDFRERLEELSACEAPENEKKHIRAEMHELQELLLAKGGWKKHAFTGFECVNEVILTTPAVFRDLLAGEISSKKILLKSGIRTVTAHMEELLGCRLWREMLFVIHGPQNAPETAEELGAWLTGSDLMEILAKNHSGEAPWYFRISAGERRTEAMGGDFIKAAAQAVEEASGRRLVNSPSHYELEIRLAEKKDGGFLPLLKLYTLPDHRFAYRRYAVAAGMKPSLAAGLLALAKPYLKEYAQVLDPFCGAGTLLIERRFLTPVRNLYGIDVFGEAVAKARANTKAVGFQANYINRDYFDFTHAYLFDEIITDMPAGNGKAETDLLYRRFFEKSAELLAEHGRIVMYSGEMGLVKKYLRLQNRFRLLQEFCIQEKRGMYLFILEKKD